MITLTKEQKEEVIKYFKEHCQIYCKCGALMEASYEGESQCPKFREDYDKFANENNFTLKLYDNFEMKPEVKALWDNHDVWGDNGDLDTARFITKLFNITMEELR